MCANYRRPFIPGEEVDRTKQAQCEEVVEGRGREKSMSGSYCFILLSSLLMAVGERRKHLAVLTLRTQMTNTGGRKHLAKRHLCNR